MSTTAAELAAAAAARREELRARRERFIADSAAAWEDADEPGELLAEARRHRPGQPRSRPSAPPMVPGGPADRFTQARTAIRAQARGRPTPPSPERVERAAQLLHAVWAAGLEHGVDVEAWAAVTSLPGACLDVTRHPR